VAANLRAWGHVRLFTPWDLDVSPRLRRHLGQADDGLPVPAGDACPTGGELAELCARAAALPAIAPHLRLGTRVLAVGRQGLLKHEEIASAERGRRPFRLLIAANPENPENPENASERIEHATVVIDATGTWGHPNWLGDGGIPAAGERQLDGEIRRTIPNLAREAADWAGRTVLVAGGGASAQTAVRDLAELAAGAPGTRVIWALRGDEPAWSGPAGDPLPERARLTAAARRLAGGASPAVTVERGVVVEALARANGAAESADPADPADNGGRLLVTLRDGRAAGTAVTDEAAGAAAGARAAAADGSGAQTEAVTAGTRRVAVDRVLSLTGAVGDHQLYRQLQVHECYATCGPMKLSAALLGAAGGDCLEQTAHGVETLTNPEPGFYIVGAKSYGRNNTFLLRVGWEQVAEVFAGIQRGQSGQGGQALQGAGG
jgi:hypothetical protein